MIRSSYNNKQLSQCRIIFNAIGYCNGYSGNLPSQFANTVGISFTCKAILKVKRLPKILPNTGGLPGLSLIKCSCSCSAFSRIEYKPPFGASSRPKHNGIRQTPISLTIHGCWSRTRTATYHRKGGENANEINQLVIIIKT